MKKVISIILALVISLSCMTVVFAADPVYACPYSRYEYVKGEDGSYSYELVECGQTFSTLAAYDAHVLTCRYHSGNNLGLDLSLSNVSGTFLHLYKTETEILGKVVPVFLKVVEVSKKVIEVVKKLAAGELF